MKTLIVLSLVAVSTLLSNCSTTVYEPPVATTTTTTTHERVVANPDMQTTTVMRQY